STARSARMSNDSPRQPADAISKPPRRAWLFVVVAIVLLDMLAIFAILWVESAERLPPAEAFLAKFSVAGLSTILLFACFVFLAPVSRAIRVFVGVIGVAVAAAAL